MCVRCVCELCARVLFRDHLVAVIVYPIRVCLVRTAQSNIASTMKNQLADTQPFIGFLLRPMTCNICAKHRRNLSIELPGETFFSVSISEISSLSDVSKKTPHHTHARSERVAIFFSGLMRTRRRRAGWSM